MESPYKYVVYVNKKFVSGALKGLSFKDSAHFVSWACADSYSTWANQHSKDPVRPSGGSSEYIVEASWVEAL